MDIARLGSDARDAGYLHSPSIEEKSSGCGQGCAALQAAARSHQEGRTRFPTVESVMPGDLTWLRLPCVWA
jgi:hypothetical protein